ncbi:hypothetical protein KEJ50_05820 [Candidatus Bathyarchaeota archaeon]|nr:hypothetical protein [Candidatus Bathyarchaeota archaeon]
METYEDEAGCLHIMGEIKNNEGMDVWGLTTVRVFYDKEGEIAVTKPNYISSKIRSGGIGRYDALMEPTDMNQKPFIDYYAIIVESYYYNMIAEFPHVMVAMLNALGIALTTLGEHKYHLKPSYRTSLKTQG